MIGVFLFKPIAKVGNETVRMYEFIKYSLSDRHSVIERMVDELAFKKLVDENGISVNEEEIQNGLKALHKQSDISYKACLKSIEYQKVLEKFSSEVQITADKARGYYENNKWRYGEDEPDFETVKNDIQMEMGVAKYEERLCKIKEEYKVHIME